MKDQLTGKRGFTLVEIMVVIAIMTIMMSFAGFDYVKTAPKRRLEGAAYDVLATLRQARMMAATGNTTAKVTIAGNTITVWVDNNNNGIVDANESFTKIIDSKITVFKSPDNGTFDSRGMFFCSSYYLYLGLHTANAGYQYIYIFPSGQVDLYSI